MRQISLALFAGLLFGAGLALSGMCDPAKVRGFLDIFGAWNPTLAFVMGGALLPTALAWRVQRKLRVPLAAPAFSLPGTSGLDAKLLGGAALFGIGWGIAGLCPGPGLADLAFAPARAGLFVLAMVAGMGIFKLTMNRRANMPGSKGR